MIGLIRWHLRQRRWFIFWWILAIVCLVGLNLAFYPSFRDQASELEKSFSQLSDTTISFISDTGDLFSQEGYLSSQVFYLMLPMLLSVLSIVIGSSLIAREEKEGTIELLLSRPISRSRLLATKALSGVTILAIVGFACLVTVTFLCQLVGIDIAIHRIALTTVMSLVFALTVGVIAFTLSALGSFGRAMSVGVATLVALSGYILSSLLGVATWLEWPARFLPFYYYRPAETLTGVYNWSNLWYFVFILTICAFSSFSFFKRRDIG